MYHYALHWNSLIYFALLLVVVLSFCVNIMKMEPEDLCNLVHVYECDVWSCSN